MIDLEAALTDLAEHLDHPAGDDLAAAVRPAHLRARNRTPTTASVAGRARCSRSPPQSW